MKAQGSITGFLFSPPFCHSAKTFAGLFRGVYTTEQKWHGSDKNRNGSNSFCKETVNFSPFRNGSIGAYGPDTERIKFHCFFAKTIGTVPVFVGSVSFLFCRVNAPFVTARVDFGIAFSLKFLSSSAFLGFRKTLQQDGRSSSVSRRKYKTRVRFNSLAYNLIPNVFLVC